MARLIKKFGTVNVIGLIFTALLFPTILSYIKFTFLLLFLSTSLLLFFLRKEKKRIFDPYIFVWLCFIIGLNLFFVLWGSLNDAPAEGTTESLYNYILYPLFYVFFIAALPEVLSIRTLTVVLLSLTIITSYIVIAQFFRKSGIILPGYELLYYVYPDLQWSLKTFAFTGDSGYLPRVMERLVFLAPFSVALVVGGKSISLSRFIVWTNLMLVTLAIIISERRAMIIILLLAIMMVLSRWVILHLKRLRVISLRGVTGSIIAIMVVLFCWLGVVKTSIVDTRIEQGLSRIITSYTEGTLSIRSEQFSALIDATGESPLLGAGFGNTASSYERSSEYPWRFELTYVALFFQTGLFGVILYAMVFILLVLIAINSFKKSGDVILPYIFGLAGGLLAVATNPYLSYGTGQWILFLPLAVFNSILLAKDRKITLVNRLRKIDMRTTG